LERQHIVTIDAVKLQRHKRGWAYVNLRSNAEADGRS